MGYKIRVLSAEEISRTFNGGNRAIEAGNITNSDSVFLAQRDVNAITKALRKATTVPVGRPTGGCRPLITPRTNTSQTISTDEITPVVTPRRTTGGTLPSTNEIIQIITPTRTTGGQTPSVEEILPVVTTTTATTTTPKIIADRLRNRVTGSSYSANGEIDQDFRQGKTGDCWLLASIEALALSPKGLKLLNDSIKKLSDGRIQVTLKGVGATYTFTEDELRSRSKLSSGDLDVRALEMAVEKYLKKHPMNGHSTLNGNLGWVAFKLITGKNVSYSDTGRFTDRQIDVFNNTNHVAVVAHNGNGRHRYKNKKGKPEELIGNHEYAVKGSDRENVYLVNPWNTAEVISVPRAEFKRFFNFVNEFEL